MMNSSTTNSKTHRLWLTTWILFRIYNEEIIYCRLKYVFVLPIYASSSILFLVQWSNHKVWIAGLH